MNNKLIVSPSPHIRGGESTSRLMLNVVIALIPALMVSVWVFGWNVLAITGVSIVCCVGFEYLIQRYMLRGPLTVDNMSAVVTGLLLALNLPAGLPLWMVAVGAFVAIVVGKMTFGGLGKNPFNPALVGRVFLLLSFPVAMADFPALADSMSGATPLAAVKAALKEGHSLAEGFSQISYQDLLLGLRNGSFGEVSAIALLLGGLYLLIRRVITWHIPVAVLGSMALFMGILWAIDPTQYLSPVFHLLTGGAVLGALFMATDYVTSPMTWKGGLIFGAGIGVITILVRVWGTYPEGMSFAILIMNAFVPLIDKYVKPRPFGAVKKSRA